MYLKLLLLVLFAWFQGADVREVTMDPVNAGNGQFSVNVSFHIWSISDLDIVAQKFEMDSTSSQYYFLTGPAADTAFAIVRRRIPPSALNRSMAEGTPVVVPYPNILDFWRPELLCNQASSLQLQTTFEKPTTLSMRRIDGGLLMKLEQKRRATFDCPACLKYYPMQVCHCRVDCANTIKPVSTFWQDNEDTYKGALWFDGVKRLIDNEVEVARCKPLSNKYGTGICFSVKFTPIVSFLILSTFLPVFLLVLASFGTSFMSVDSVIERIAVSSIVFQSVLTLYIQARLNIPPVSHITIMDIFILVSVITVMATIFQTVVVKLLVQRQALYNINQHAKEKIVQRSEGQRKKRKFLSLRPRTNKPESTTSLFGTLFRYSTSLPPYPATRFNRLAGRLLVVLYLVFAPLFWWLALHIAKAPKKSSPGKPLLSSW